MTRVNKVGHIVLNVGNLEASVAFYAAALGMEVMRTREGGAFLSFGTQHHDLALFQAPDGAERGGLGLNHIAFQIEGGDTELRALYGRLIRFGARIDSAKDHGMTHSVYFFDPDGNRLEVFCETMGPDAGREHIRHAEILTIPDYPLEPILPS